MSLPKVCVFTMIAAVFAFAAVGTLSVTIKEYEVPTPKSRPHDPALAPDGSLWYTGQAANKLGTIDPRTMAIHEYTLPANSARPRRLALAPDGTVFYTDYARGYLGHFDPAAGKLLKEWTSPGGADSEPYGIAVTKEGDVWYSESGVKPNTLVRFDPRTESFGKEPIPSGGGVVRNMVATPDGHLYLACSGVNKVAVVDVSR